MKMITIALIMTLALTPFVLAQTQTIRIYPSDDAFVNDRNRNTNYGSEANLRIGFEASKGTDRSFLIFDLSSINKEINSATLSLDHLGSHDNPTVSLFIVGSTGWSENSITWNNQPGTGTQIDSLHVTNQNRLTFDVTEEVSNSDKVSFALIEQGENGFANSFSKELNTGVEGDELNWPYLEIIFEGEGTGNETTCNTLADVNCDGCVSLNEIVSTVVDYKKGQSDLNLQEIVELVVKYKNGEISC